MESGPATTVVVLYGWDDQQQVIGSCQQISCKEGPNLLLPFFGQDSFFNVLDSFHFTIQNRENYVVSYCFRKQWSERQALSGSGFEDASVVHRR